MTMPSYMLCIARCRFTAHHTKIFIYFENLETKSSFDGVYLAGQASASSGSTRIKWMPNNYTNRWLDKHWDAVLKQSALH